MIRRMLKGDKGSNVGAIYSSVNEQKIHWCQSCLNVGVSSILKNRIYLDEDGKITSPAPDYKKWLMCHRCGNIVHIVQAKPEAELTSEVKAMRSNRSRGHIEGIGRDRKLDRTGRSYKWKKLEQDLTKIKDEELKDDLRKGKKLIFYQES